MHHEFNKKIYGLKPTLTETRVLSYFSINPVDMEGSNSPKTNLYDTNGSVQMV